jgi:transcription elongation factor Elf1
MDKPIKKGDKMEKDYTCPKCFKRMSVFKVEGEWKIICTACSLSRLTPAQVERANGRMWMK